MRAIRLSFRYPESEMMLHELSKYGRTISKKPCATRELSIKLRPLKKLNIVYFSQTYVGNSKTTIITLKPGKTLQYHDNKLSIRNP